VVWMMAAIACCTLALKNYLSSTRYAARRVWTDCSTASQSDPAGKGQSRKTESNTKKQPDNEQKSGFRDPFTTFSLSHGPHGLNDISGLGFYSGFRLILSLWRQPLSLSSSMEIAKPSACPKAFT
jgi:hypothetical protein